MSVRSQLLKGILEGCILAVISKETIYGYELTMKLRDMRIEVSEGSIYPILLRLQKEQLIVGEMRESPSGPNRKYYTLTDKGEEALQQFRMHWDALKGPVDELMQKGGGAHAHQRSDRGKQ
ncbi:MULTISPECIES: PadR family transcriptional regulator [Paenibacillus]|uniref:PadR family transcriptional regulator n=1 Tax=Paenibacillus campinasensis TaxID=66347 RepID=A0A268F221_9BACL|nr:MULTISPECIES: PadR family transcriptional regulator [Paenibacillus]MUG65869.1 PadR family transcriptional regulator [Paenibacillus campinasensis]PAD79393.1 PadR family transcriptional regulator [Paenibacillus campinasensis]PAK51664.1 PadR family transcriptional regulator [Paenibacillus sp. 7541]